MRESVHHGLQDGAAEPKADLSAWLAVAAGTIGAFMAMLDISIVNAALPTIQGGIGASAAEGTWVSTAYLVAEIVMIPLAAWLANMLGLRRFLIIVAALFTLFSMVCGLSNDLTQMILGRLGQGFTGGAMIPMAMTIVATRLPPAQQPLGIGLFGMTAVLGPVLGPITGGWLTEHLSWHYAFFLNLPVGAGLILLLLFGVPDARPRWDMIAEADLPGMAGLALGLGGLTTLLEEGQRDQWFESPFIMTMALTSASGFLLLFAGQAFSRRPVIRLGILFERAFGGVFVLTLGVGAAFYGIVYIIPQFLVSVAGYNAEQSGLVAMVSGLPTIALMALFPALVRRIDLRAAIALGLVLYAASCFMDMHLSELSAGPQFLGSQLLRGLAQFFCLMFLNQAAACAVRPDLAEDASGLFNVARNLGGSIGLAAIAVVQEQRTFFHAARLSESMAANNPVVHGAIDTQGLAQIAGLVQDEAAVMAFADLYWVFGAMMLLMIPLVLLLKPVPKGAGIAMML